MRIRHSLLLASLLTAVSAAASAQAPPTPATPPARTAPPEPQAATDCTPMRPTPPSGKLAPEGGTTGQAADPLGDKLARSDGVVCPPAGIDPQIRAPTPDAGNMPVIPPPGSPGGNPNIRPK